MATKLFKSITLGDDTFKLDDNLGATTYNRKDVALTPANTDVQGGTITLTEPGTYFLQGRWHPEPSSSTGTRCVTLNLNIKLNGSSSFLPVNSKAMWSPANNFTMDEVAAIYNFSQAQVPVEVAVFGKSNLTSPSGYTAVLACKLINTVGGVVRLFRTLINSICYRPQFGWEVA